jgi:3D (Asp-Asp-Asp) domain-containing protein
MNTLMIGLGVVTFLLFLSFGISWMWIRNLRREITDLKTEMTKGDAALHERVNMINDDLGDAYIQLEGTDEDIGRLAEANRLQSASIGALNKRLKSTEYVTDKILKQLGEKKESEKKVVTEAPKIQKEEMHEVFAETADDAPEGMTYMGVWEISAYEYTGNPTASGTMPTKWHTCAFNSAPLGATIYIPGLGYFLNEDVCGTPGRLDIFLGDVEECEQFGIQSHDVYIVN